MKERKYIFARSNQLIPLPMGEGITRIFIMMASDFGGM